MNVKSKAQINGLDCYLIDDDQDDYGVIKEMIREIANTSQYKFHFSRRRSSFSSKELIFIPNYIFTDINMPSLTNDKLILEFQKVEENQIQ